MKLGQIIGRVVLNTQDPSYTGGRFLMVHPLDRKQLSGGEGYPSFSIATTTGEGITTPMTFTRKRRCVMVNNLNIF